MSLKNIQYKPLYIVPRDNYVKEVLINSLRLSTSVDCMFGFFGSAALKILAPGWAEYLVKTTEPVRLVASPNISKADAIAIRDGVSTPSSVLENRLQELLGEAKLSASALIHHTLTCLAYMLSTKRLLFRVAWLRNGGLFHPKVWFFRDGEHTVVAHGSSNFTPAGLGSNFEQICVDTSWCGGRAEETIAKLTDEFQALWNGSGDYFTTMDLPLAIERELICEYLPENPPTADDFQKAWGADAGTIEKLQIENIVPEALTIPAHLDLDHGPFAHQSKALAAWEGARYRGCLAMATGSGKTITALAGATQLQKEVDALLVVICAPYKPLVLQWKNEVRAFGVTPLPTSDSSARRAQKLEFAIRALRTGVSKVEVLVCTNKFLINEHFRRMFDNLPESITSLLIADEVHNLGSPGFLSNPPDRFNYRLGLSATPVRQYDPEGTSALFDYFGPQVFEFSLKEAIVVCLVPYNYYIHRVSLSEEEFEKWEELTKRIIQKGFKADDNDTDSSSLPDNIKRLLIARRRVIESAEGKVDALRGLLQKRTRDTIKHVLVYTTDKNADQLQAVNDMLQKDLNLTIHELTSRQTSSRSKFADLLDRFAAGDYNILTCMRVLDEGVDLPQVSEAFIMASNTTRRQWIQRRGRILRKCASIKKELAHLHDFIVVPPGLGNACSQSILRGELDRALEFAELAENSGAPNGPFDEIKKLTTIMFA